MSSLSILNIIFIFFAVLSLIFGILGVILGCYATLKVLVLEKSTHTVQFMPTEEAIREWGTSDKEVDKINNANKDDLDTDFSSLSI